METILSLSQSLDYKANPPRGTENRVPTSFGFMTLLSQLRNEQDKMENLLFQLDHLQYFVQYSDFMTKQGLDSKLNTLQSLCKSIEQTLEHKTTIKNTLQQPFAGESIVVHSSAHREFCKLLRAMSHSISSYNQNYATLEWNKQFSCDPSPMVPVLRNIASCTARLQRYHDTLQELRTVGLKLYTST